MECQTRDKINNLSPEKTVKKETTYYCEQNTEEPWVDVEGDEPEDDHRVPTGEENDRLESGVEEGKQLI